MQRGIGAQTHPLIKELLRRIEDNPADKTAKDMALMMFNTGASLNILIFLINLIIFLITLFSELIKLNYSMQVCHI